MEYVITFAEPTENELNEMGAVLERVISSKLPRNIATACAELIKLAAAKGLAGTGIESIKISFRKERNLAASKFFFRNATTEEDFRDVICFATSMIACLLEKEEIDEGWLADMIGRL